MTIYEKNLALIKTKNEKIYKALMGKDRFPIIVKGQNKGNICISVDGKKEVYLHSVYNKKNEFERMFKRYRGESMLLLFGIGDGSVLKYINKYMKAVKTVYIIEPSITVFKCMIERIDLSELMKQKDYYFSISEEPITAAGLAIKPLVKIDFGFYYILNERALFEEYFNSFVTFMKKNMRTHRMNVHTELMTLDLWHENGICNFIADTSDVSSVSHIFKDKVFILVSAGPSLNNNMELLHEVQDRAVIVAVGSAVKILDNNGITPHFRMMLDGQKEEMRVIRDLNDYSVPVLIGAYGYKNIIPTCTGKAFTFASNTNHFYKYLMKISEIPMFGPLWSGPSIANAAFSFAYRADVNKIILLGQDLCFQGDDIYAKGARADDDTVEKKSIRKKYFDSKDVHGNAVQTTAQFLGMRDAFENIMKVEAKRSVEVINASEGGLPIPGIINMTFQEVLDTIIEKEAPFDYRSTVDQLEHADYDIHKKEGIQLFTSQIDDVWSRVNTFEEKIKELLTQYETFKKIDSVTVTKMFTMYDDIEALEVFQQALLPSIKNKIEMLKLKFTNDIRNGADSNIAQLMLNQAIAREIQRVLLAFNKVLDDHRIEEVDNELFN